jgi:DNA-binding NarL/FixJ family response regulator
VTHASRGNEVCVFGELGVIILSGYEHDVQLHYATQLRDLGGSGGVGYLFKDRTSRSGLKEAVQRVAAGGVVVDPLFSQEAADEYRSRHADMKDFSDREVEVLDLLVQGLTNKEIADKLYLSIAVIERHLTKIFKHLATSETGAELYGSGDSRRENRRVLTVLEALWRLLRLPAAARVVPGRRSHRPDGLSVRPYQRPTRRLSPLQVDGAIAPRVPRARSAHQ